MRVALSVLMIFALLAPLAKGQIEVDPEWVYRWYWVPDESDQGDAIVCDRFGNVYIAGHTDTSASYSDWVTVRLNSEGDSLWTRIYDSPDDGIDKPDYIVVDDSGYIYVAGDIGRSSLAWKMDAAVLKYDSLGNLLWVYTYNGTASLDDRVEGFGIDNDGNIFVVGYTKLLTGNPGREDYLIIKLLASGDTAWVRTLPTGNQTFDRLYDIAFDDSNYIYVTGGYTFGASYDVATIKYNQAGDTLWMRLYDGPSSGSDVPVGIGIDDSGYVYVGGYTYNTSKDVLALKYDPEGNLIWSASYDGAGHDLENPRDMTVDSDGNVLIVSETTMGGQRDFLVTKFDNTGALAWAFQYDAGGNANEIVFNNKALIKVDDEGYVYFGGATYYVPTGLTLTNTMTFKLDPDGNVVWYNRYGGPGLDFDQIRAITLDDDANCYVTGYSDGIYDNWDLFVLKFSGEGGPSGCEYAPGDANGDGSVLGSDVTYSVRYFKGLGPNPPDSCWNDSTSSWLYSGGDANGNCAFTGSDVTFLVAYFKGNNPEILYCPQTPPAGLWAGRRIGR